METEIMSSPHALSKLFIHGMFCDSCMTAEIILFN